MPQKRYTLKRRVVYFEFCTVIADSTQKAKKKAFSSPVTRSSSGTSHWTVVKEE